MACFVQVKRMDRDNGPDLKVIETIFLNLDDVSFMRPRKDGHTTIRCGGSQIIVEEGIPHILQLGVAKAQSATEV